MRKDEYKEFIENWKKENKELIESGKCKKMFFEILPIKTVGGRDVIDWCNSVGNNVYFLYNDTEGFIEIKEYCNCKCTIYYKDNNKYMTIRTEKLKCCSIAYILNKRTSEFKIKIKDVLKDNKRDFVIINREYRKIKYGDKIQNQKWYKYHCNKCGNEDWMTESSILKQKQGCNRCSGHNKVDETNCIATTHPHLMKYLVNKEDGYKFKTGSANKINIKCPDCGNVKTGEIRSLLKIFSCPKCSDGISYPNKFMYNLLNELNVDFETEYSPKWANGRRYDFYFEYNNNRYIVEMDGGFHYKSNSMNGLSVEEIKEIDRCKDKLAKEHNIEIIRINCDYNNISTRFIHIRNNIINSKLSEIYDLCEINWNKINEESQKSLVKKVCNYWYLHNDINNEGLTTKDIGKIFCINYNTVSRYLKIGVLNNWCKYIEKDKALKKYNNKKCLRYNRKPIIIYKDKKLINMFISSAELERQSEKLFGVFLNSKCILKVANGARNTYKGFTFKHTTIEEYEDYIYKKSTYSPKN